MTQPNGDQQWAAMALILADQPATVRTILAEHVPNSAGMCAGCTSGGTGATRTVHPCAVRRLAERAQSIQRARRQ
ncbi:MAG: hypothetical protein L0H84_17225 [Pseudonocardia sp.]|nr:hypothetical protein [Pseudonocardia sp.]